MYIDESKPGIEDIDIPVYLNKDETKIEQIELPDNFIYNLGLPELASNALGWLVMISSILTVLLTIVAAVNKLGSPMKDKLTYFSIERDIKQRQMVESILQEFINISKCHRVCVGLFSNGTSIGTVHYKKMNITHEAVAPGVTSFRERFQNISTLKLEQEILNSTSYKFTEVSLNDSTLITGCRNYMRSNSLHTILSRRLVNKRGMYGLLELQYIDEPEKTIVYGSQEYHQLEDVFNHLSNMLNYVVRNRLIPTR